MISSRAVLLVLPLAVWISAVPAVAAGPPAEPEVRSVRERVVLPGATVVLDVRARYPSPPCSGDLIDFQVTLENVSQGQPGSFTGSIENAIPGGTSFEPGSATGGAVFDQASQRLLWEGPLEVGASKTIGFGLRVDSSLPPGILVINRTVATAGGGSIVGNVPFRVCGHDAIRPEAPPEIGPWLSSPDLPGFEAKIVISPRGQSGRFGSEEPECIVETLCVSGALEGRPELFVKLVGPRPNGFLWTQVARFTPSRVVIWLRQVSTGLVRLYVLDAAGPEESPLGLQDRQAFYP